MILTVQAQAPVSILGCLGDYTWCDVTFGYRRGWMKSIYLSELYQGYYYPLRDYAPRLGYSVVDFDINQYWRAYYRDHLSAEISTVEPPSLGRLGVDKAVFYDRLQPYGEWVWLEGRYVWVPVNVDGQSHPYTSRVIDYIPIAMDGCGPGRTIRLGNVRLRPLGFLKSGWMVLGAGQPLGSASVVLASV